jgi:hypothetical protein
MSGWNWRLVGEVAAGIIVAGLVLGLVGAVVRR